MVDIAQQGLPPEDGQWLKALTRAREMNLGIYLEVVAPGVVRAGEHVTPA
jgi:hypothetical protein